MKPFTAAQLLGACLLIASPLVVSSLVISSDEQPQQGYTRTSPSAMRSAPTQGVTRLKIGERSVDVYMKKPQGEGTWPGIVLLHDSMGLTPQTIKMVDRLSGEGFIVVAPDLYGGRFALDSDKGRELATLMSEEDALGATDALAAHLKGLDQVGNHRVGLVGFDLGGRLALRGAMGSSDVSSVVVAYSVSPVDADDLRRIGCPILGLFGGKDEIIPMRDVEAFRASLSAAGRTAEVKIYEQAGHGFMKNGDPMYHADAAGEAWTRMVAFLKDNL